MGPDDLAARIRDHPAMAGVLVLVLHGSRSRGDARPDSDWDLGVLADAPVDLPALAAATTQILGTDAVDVVDLAGASALLRYRAARDGIALVEVTDGAFDRFRLEAVQFWCDAGTVIRAAQADVLEALG